MKKLKLFIKGIGIGIANIIPGVSGGTMAVIMGVYALMVDFLSFKWSVIKKKWADILFLALGMGSGIILLSWPLKYLLANFNSQCNYFFAGVVIGSIPLIYSKTKNKNNGKKQKKISLPSFSGIICFVLMLALMIAIYVVSGGISKEDGGVMDNSIGTYLFMIPAGVLAAVSMIIPGISGSFIMVVIGAYQTILSALSFDSLNILILLCFGIGALIGVVGGARLISYLLKKFSSQTYMGILGLIVGSVPYLISFGWLQGNSSVLITIFSGVVHILLLCIGAAVTYLFGKMDPENN